MINLLYLGLGGKHTKLIRDTMNRLGCRRPALLSAEMPADQGFTVAICAAGIPMTPDRLRDILKHPTVTFVVGDIQGIPVDIVRNADCVMSVGGSMPLTHEFQALLVAEVTNQAVPIR